MATLVLFQDFKEQLGKGVHDFSTHTFKWALTNSAPSATNTILSNITQITAANGYTSGGAAVGTPSYTETSGTGTFTAGDDTVFTASGGSIGPFRYAVLYNDTATSPADALVGYLDYGSSITVADGDPFTVKAGNVLTVA